MKHHKHLSILCLVVAVIVLFAKNNSLKSDIEMLQNSLSNESSRLETQISSIYSNVENQLKKQASLLSDVTYETGELDINIRTVDVLISVLPKELTENMTVEISFDGKTSIANRNTGGKFTAVFSAGLFVDHNTYPLLTIKSGDITRTEYLETVHISNLWVDYLPTIIKGDFDRCSATLDDNGVTVNGNLQFDFSLAKTNHNVKFINYSVIAEADGKEIARKDLTKEIENNLSENAFEGNVTIPFKETYNIAESDNVSLYFSAEDSLGYIHHTLAFSWTLPDKNGRQPEQAVAVTRYGGEWITDKEGNILYGKGFLN